MPHWINLTLPGRFAPAPCRFISIACTVPTGQLSWAQRGETSDSVWLSKNQFDKTTIIFKVKWNKLMQKLHQLGTVTHLAVPSCRCFNSGSAWVVMYGRVCSQAALKGLRSFLPYPPHNSYREWQIIPVIPPQYLGTGEKGLTWVQDQPGYIVNWVPSAPEL